MRINNPTIPYSGPIQGGLKPGMTVYFKGTFHRNIDRFAFNLLAQNDKALHFNGRFKPKRVVVINTFRRRKWECEERVENSPFKEGEGFEVLFIVKLEGYQVNVNGSPFYMFKHRMPAQSVTGLHIRGELSMETVIISTGEEKTCPRAEDVLGGGLKKICSDTGKLLPIPFVAPIAGGLKNGMCFYFKGTIPKDAKRFHINLQSGVGEAPNKALHFNPRFEGKEMVVLNSFQRGGWEKRECPDEMPFHKGGEFELVIITTAVGFQVFIHGKPVYLFKHRMPVNATNAIKIVGDVSILVFKVEVDGGLKFLGKTEPPEIAVCERPARVKIVTVSPNVQHIYGGLRVGMSVYFKGTVPKDCKRFSINLHCGDRPECNNAFHFNPRLDPRKAMIFNTFQKGWEQEEKAADMLFRKGEDFELLYRITAEGYQVDVNGKFLYLFKHRLPVEDVTAIRMVADVSIEIINIIQGGESGLQGYLAQSRIMVPDVIPYTRTIYGGLRAGMYLYFRGTVPNKLNERSFHINLQYSQRRGHVTAIHFSPQFQQKAVVFNTFTKRKWQKGERVNRMPFHRGQSFEILFCVDVKGYRVYVNGCSFYVYKHRVPFQHVNVIGIKGDVDVDTIDIVGGGRGGVEAYQGLRTMTIQKLPYVGPVLGGLRPGMHLYFHGKIPKDPERFHISLQFGEKAGSWIALHLNPCFKPQEAVIFNSFQNGKWDNEERVNQMPFRKGEAFEIVLIITTVGFQVIVNGRPFHMFKHRLSLLVVSALAIGGNVSMKTVHMIRGVRGALEGHPSLGKLVITKIPHVGPIYGGLRAGMALFFQGAVPKDCKRFNIILQLGQPEGSDHAMNFSPRLDSGMMVVNSCRNGNLENEEKPAGMPFQKGEDFEVTFVVTVQGYQVYVNGRSFHMFRHRMAVEHVCAVKIIGDVTIQTANITEAGKLAIMRHLGPGRMVVTKLPFVGTIQGCLRTGIYMYFRGTVPQDADRFHINLKYGQKKDSDIALSFTPQFKPSEAVVFNSFQNGGWQQEERVHQMPFRKGAEFEMVIIVTPVGYQVIVNGRSLYLFKHRMPVEQVSALGIAGDVSMQPANLVRQGQGLAGIRRVVVSKVPHVGPVYGGLRTGMFLFFRGTIPEKINRFSIDLEYGELDNSDKAIHFNPQLDTNMVVFNTIRNGQWEKEERVFEIPFQKGKDFEVIFIITPLGYQVVVNGNQFHFFKHRMPVEHVCAIKTSGDVNMQTIDAVGGEDEDEEEEEGRPDTRKIVISKIPHVGPIHRFLRTGMALHFQGTIPEEASGFIINLQYGQMESCTKALHLNSQFTPCEAVGFNTFRNGSWEKEEKVFQMPFTKGEEFEIVILIKSEGFQVFVNGQKFYFFKHRMPVEIVSAISISGDVSIETVDVNQEEPEKPEEKPAEKAMVRSIPSMGPIYSGLRPGMAVYFKGSVPEKACRFSLNLLCGDTDGSRELTATDIAFHFNPRFDEKSVIFNSCRNGGWEKREQSAGMPFRKGEDFEVFFFVTAEGYQVKVNGQDYYSFKHRMPVQNVRAIKVVADVSVQIINIIEGVQEGVQEQLTLGKIAVNKIPHVGPIYGGLRKGMYLYFQGKADDDFSSFHISLQYGKKHSSEKAFHLHPQSEPKKTMVLNTFRNGNWETGEKVDEMPFRKGEDFEVVLIVTSKGYQVIINGRPFYCFKHRMAVEPVTTMEIDGDVTMKTITLIGSGARGFLGYRGLRKMLVTKIPCDRPIYGGLTTGTYIYFRGTVPQTITSFTINLQNGLMKGCDRALHFKPQFKPCEAVAFNTFRNGKWENVDLVREMPFTKGKEFELLFIVTSLGYQVIVNGRFFHLFKHRMPVEHVGALAIGGDVTMQTVNMTRGGEVGRHPSLGKMVISKIPHVGPVYGGLKAGMYLYFRGTLPKDVKSFDINLQSGQMEGSDIACQFKPCFQPSEGVMFNSFCKGSWETEERVDKMPFTKGGEYELLFIVTLLGYQVNINGRQFYVFKHRLPVENVCALKIVGDISVQNVDVTEGGQEAIEEKPDEKETVKLPHVRPVQGGLRPGMYLYFKGTIPQDIKLFAINLQYGQIDGCDIAWQCNPRFDRTEMAVFNSFENGSWKQEEKATGMPFRKGEDFEIYVFVTTSGYQMNVNGRQFHSFNHRMPVDQVSAVKVVGDVSLQTIDIFRGGPVVPGQPGLGKVVISKIPHVGPVYGGLRPGMYLYFWGTIPQSTERFHINLQCGQMEGSDIACRFNPCFQPSEGVTFNSFRNGSWETEERVDLMPFKKGCRFEVFFIITAAGYQVIVNGRPFYLFKHRMPVEQVTVVNIGGDVCMESMNTVVRTLRGQDGQPGLGKMLITKIPHVRPVYGGLRKGMFLYFRGVIPQNINRFNIDLQCGEIDGCDKAMQFSPRFRPQPTVVFNSVHNGKLGMEETVDEMPFEPGKSFELLFVVTSKGFRVKVNGRVLYTFLHRVPVEYVSAVRIAGDVSIETGDIAEGGEEEEAEEEEKVVPSIPAMRLVAGGLIPGMALHFNGIIPQKPKRFAISLSCGEAEGSDLAFRFAPRFESSEVAFNTFQNSSWGEEERVKQIPFDAGEEFDVVFGVTTEGYQVKVNDSKFHFFKHRIPMVKVTAIKFFGDVSIQTINITEGGRLNQGKMVMDSSPYVEPILNGLRTGMALYFRGKLENDVNRFGISLECGEMKGCEKALHFRPQFQPSKMVLFNSFQNGKWDVEEKIDTMPFRKGENFEVVLSVTASGYQVNINGHRFHMFKHRVAVERVTSLRIFGDVSMETIDIIGGGIPGYRGLQNLVVTKVPHVGPIFGGLRTGTYLYFRGTVPKEVNRFAINLQYGQLPGSDIAMHFNPQIDSNVVGINTFRNGRWENVENPVGMPFRKGEDFEVLFIITSVGYQVNVNGRFFHCFNHRMPVQHVCALAILGNITVQTATVMQLLTEFVFQGGEGARHPSLGKMVVTKIPHVGPVYGGLKPGMFLTFRGTVPQEIKSFAIDLQYGQLSGSDIAMHFNPQFGDKEAVAFNTFHNGSWEQEERASGMPFQKGKEFEIVIPISTEGYQVYVNGRHFYLFRHRMPVDQVCAVNITGDISLKTVDMIEGGEDAPVLPPPAPVVVTTTPHVEPVTGGLRPGMYLYFKGTVPQNVKWFAINLQYGQIEGCDRALHFKPRFDGTEAVAFNTFKNGKWEQKEEAAWMPFSKGGDFEILIIVTTKGFQVFVNGRHFYLFTHRMPVETVSAIKIVGDVSIQSINMIDGGKRQMGETVITKIPHVVTTYGGLRPGMYLYFKGTVPKEMKSFAISLQYGQIKGSDIALHFNPRLHDKGVVLNSFKNGSWEQDEKPAGMPFCKGEDFEILCFITPEGYQVNVNGRQFHLFKHRMPADHVSAINITGDVIMQSLNMVQGGQVVETQGKIVVPSIPHVGAVYGGLRPGMALFFQGTVPEDTQSFAINLQYGMMKGSDVAFHLKPQFEPTEGVLFNTFRNGSWEEEESVEEMPFEPGDSFEMALIVTTEGYQIIVNGLQYYLFKHRMPVEQVSALEITGNVFIHNATMMPGEDVQIKKKMAEQKKEIVPEMEPIPGILVMGKALLYRGIAPSQITSFAVNLRCGNAKDSDIAFHFNPQFEPTEGVSMNSFQNGSWGVEERVEQMPFRKGESFELVYMVLPEGYQVWVNRQQFCLFKHRMALENVTSIEIAGEVSVQDTSCIDDVEVHTEEVPDLDKVEVAPAVPVPTGLKTGMSMSFQGMIPMEVTWFSIILQCGDAEDSDKALYFSPQFQPSEGVVFNSFQNGSWETEEKVDQMPFRRGENFLLLLEITQEGYQATVNGTPFYMFKHRIAMDQVRAIKIFGNVIMQNANVIKSITTEAQVKQEEVETVQSETPITSSLRTGSTLTFEGMVPAECKRFIINLQSGDTPGCDIPFHFSPQFESSEVVFKTFRNGSWEKAEKIAKMPFTKGEKFVMIYTLTAEGYQVKINDADFHMYKHRIPMDQVRALQIAGDISVPTFEIVEGAVQEYPSPSQLGTVQSVKPVPGSLQAGMTLTFQGVVPDVSKSFSINLLCGDTKDSDLAFHFSPQFETSEVVCNTFCDGKWEEAEKVDKLPFVKGKKFMLVYIVTAEGYQVKMKDTDFYFFKHRIPLDQVRVVQVAGDVLMKIVNVEEPVPEYPAPAQLGPVQSVAPMPGTLKPGMSMFFKGMIPMEITRFCINLPCGVTDGCDMALHINVLFDTSEVLFNTFRNGSWEEADRVAAMPFVKGESFTLLLITTSAGYQVNVNGKEFHLFTHRITFDQVTSLQVIGDVVWEAVNIVQETTEAYPCPTRLGPVHSVTPVTESLKSGMSVSFEGSIPADLTRFCINLQCGDTEDADTAFHLRAQFDTSEVVFNSFQLGSWGEEEKVTEMPFRKGECFVLVLDVTSDGYQVKVNGNELYLFRHRVPAQNVKMVQVIENIILNTMNIIETSPSVTPLPGGLAVGTSVTFLGNIPNRSAGFNIVLRCGTTDNSDIAFQFNPQFVPVELVLMNSLQKGSWGVEEQITEMPFQRGENFKLVFLITDDAYQVSVNDHEIHQFKHRISPGQVRALQIAGNVNMPTVNIMEGALFGLQGTATACFEKVVVTMAPMMVPIQGGLKEGMSVNFKFSIPKDIPSFSIDLMRGQAAGSDMALHLSAQFEPSAAVLFNSFQSGAWGQEERLSETPFQRGASCDLVLLVAKEGYQVKVNDVLVHTFQHRVSLAEVTALQITGNIIMEMVNIIEGGIFGMGACEQMVVSGPVGGETWTCETGGMQQQQTLL